MKRWVRRAAIGVLLTVVVSSLLFEGGTRTARGWLGREPFYAGYPASYWAEEIERWETHDPDWDIQNYARRPVWPQWMALVVPEPGWPSLLDGDPDGLPVLNALRDHPSESVQDWARIGIERIDNGKRGPYKLKDPSVIISAQLYEVDEAFYKKIGGKWHSLADLEKLEALFLEGGGREPTGNSLFEFLGKQEPLRSVKDVKIENGKEAVLLSSTKEIRCLPSPAQRRKGNTEPQTIEEGVTLRAQVQVASDRRLIRVRFIEKSWEIEGIDNIPVLLDNAGNVAATQIASVKESTLSVPRNIPDGGTMLLPLQYRSATNKDKGRWLVVRINPRIYIEAEERLLRGEAAR